MAFQLTSTAFALGSQIPRKYTGEGLDISPPLSWDGIPAGVKQLALVCDDPDAPTAEPWVHWVLYKIPTTLTSLPEGIPRKARLGVPAEMLQGRNSWPEAEAIGYRGPMPPRGHGVHRYYFRLFALAAEMALEPGLTKKDVLEQMARCGVVAEAVLMGTYER